MYDETEQQRTVKGRVKWFAQGKGFGFVTSDDVAGDILLHGNVLQNFGRSSIAEGSEVDLVIRKTASGWQATEVLSISVSADIPASSFFAETAELSAAELQQLMLQPARMKWFDKQKGFGFANIFGLRGDIFVHADVVRQGGLTVLEPGEAVALRSISAQSGMVAVQIMSWDAATVVPGSS